MDNKEESYSESFSEYKICLQSFVKSDIYENTLECAFESLNDWSIFFTLNQVKNWFLQKREEAYIHIKEIPLKELRGWCINEQSGNIYHQSKGFFNIRGLRVTTLNREAVRGWDQPILEEVGYDGGIVGLVRKRFNGIPHYLCEAKIEPGNYGKVQLSPTLQATFSNINKIHEGRSPYFIDLFINSENYDGFKLLFDAWLAEDGGRLYLKRNRGMLLEVPDSFEIVFPNDNFIWLSLYQIKALLKEDAWVNPHIRGILSHV